ncbi:MAG: uroporphyrinogen-III C-methyltransferase [Ignavibacteria bacterium]|nr:uroporphyrinogen-III C-methyltransferase [Ignavibacteria bacterium]MBI3766849.1 uroporphyrinogen-III C-methyltransferase [Ignavibacteriales bacterium]
MNTLYPIFLNIEHQPVLVVGGGMVAEQKIRGLLDAKAEVTVIAPSISAAVEELAGKNKIIVHRRAYESGDVGGFFLVIGATDDKTVQQVIFNDAQSKNVPVNIVDVPQLCTFYLSSVFQKGDLKIAVSTNGKSPTLGQIIRDKIRDEFADGYPELLETIGGVRPHVLKAFPDVQSRKELFRRLVQTELERLHGRTQKGATRPYEDFPQKGKVYIIGAGPGDPELMTVKGLKILQSADVIMYDALVNTELLSYVKESAEKIFVGKRAGAHCKRQEEINELLVLKAREGKLVLRLKGGDPFIFGRGGEELEALQNVGIKVEVVPGITAGIGIPTSLGIPLTHRRHSSSVVFLTGHEDPTKDEQHVDWNSISRIDSIVIYMGVKRLHFIVDQLIQHGVSPLKPAAVIFDGTLPEEIVLTGTLEDIGEKVHKHSMNSPGLIIVGDVVRFVEPHAAQAITAQSPQPALQDTYQ